MELHTRSDAICTPPLSIYPGCCSYCHTHTLRSSVTLRFPYLDNMSRGQSCSCHKWNRTLFLLFTLLRFPEDRLNPFPDLPAQFLACHVPTVIGPQLCHSLTRLTVYYNLYSTALESHKSDTFCPLKLCF